MLIGSSSSFSHAAAAMSTNVKIMLRANQTEQDRVYLDYKAVVSAGAVGSEEQRLIDTTIADWYHCSREAQQPTGSDARSVSARRFYETVDEVAPSP